MRENGVCAQGKRMSAGEHCGDKKLPAPEGTGSFGFGADYFLE